jgi:prephenate dehydratase
MSFSIAHLGPSGTYSEWAAQIYGDWLSQQLGQPYRLVGYRKKTDAMEAVHGGAEAWAVVPIENSIEGSIREALDALWELQKPQKLQIHQEIILPITHALLSYAQNLGEVQEVRSHPQALAQCQGWLKQYVPQARAISMDSTTAALQSLQSNPTWAAISSPRAAELHHSPMLAYPINDYPENRTRFWAVGLQPSPGGSQTSLAFTLRDAPGALLKPLQVLADYQINLKRIESRPTKRMLGEYLFFIDLEGNGGSLVLAKAFRALEHCTKRMRVFGSYDRRVVQ